MDILVDTSVWVEFFRAGPRIKNLDVLIDENLICTNDLILAEIVPLLLSKRQKKLVALLENIRKFCLAISWEEIIDFQVACIRSGINNVGIPDLLIAQNAKHHHLAVFSLDHHFMKLEKLLGIKRYEE